MVLDLRWRIESQAVGQALAQVMRGLPTTGDMSPATQVMARILKTGAQMRFRSGKGPDGTPWKPSRRAEQEGGQTLSDTRRLRNSITSAFDRTSATVGTNVLYAAVHQFGGTIRAKNGPFLAIPVTPHAKAAGSPRNMAGLRVWQTIRGQFVMGTDDGTVHYLLRQKVTMPERPFLGASAADQTALAQAVKDHLAGMWQRR
jgi:phage virion morphogenesis protein